MRLSLLPAVLVALTGVPPAIAQEVPGLDTVQALLDRLNAGDRDGAAALFAEEGYGAYGADGAPFQGAALETWLQSDIVGPGAQFEIEEVTAVGGQTVATGRWGFDAAMSRRFRFAFEIGADGLIQSWRMLPPD